MYLKPTEEQRQLLRRPFGKLLNGTREQVVGLLKAEVGSDLLACVGDFVSSTALEAKLRSLIYIVDSRIERRDVPLDLRLSGLRRVGLHNPRGFINMEAWPVLRSIMAQEEPTVILVTGEEDLLMLPVVDIAPNGRKMLYGQPGGGAVLVVADESIKAAVRSMLEGMPKTETP